MTEQQKQKQNYENTQAHIKRLQDDIEKSAEFDRHRQEIGKLRKSVNQTELHPNARKKFNGWLTKLFHNVNTKEREFVFSAAEDVSEKIEELEQNPFVSVDMNELRRKCKVVKTWCKKIRNILDRKGKVENVSQEDLEELERNIDELQNRLNRIQKQRSSEFKKSILQFESELAEIEIEINELNARAYSDNDFSELFRRLNALQKRSCRFPKKKEKKYTDRIKPLFDSVKEIKKEIVNAESMNKSQHNRQQMERKIDGIEEKLAKEKISNKELENVRSEIFHNLWNPLKEKSNGSYKIFLVRKHRDDLFSTMRTMLDDISSKKADNQQYKKDCIENKQYMNEQLELLQDNLQTYFDEHYKGTSMNKGTLLSHIGSLTYKVKELHQYVKNNSFFYEHKWEYNASLNDYWVEINKLIQKIKNPEWSEQWLKEMLERNKKADSLFLQVIPGVPRA